MKATPTSRSAFVNLRVLIAFALCLTGVFMALFGFGAFSSAFAQARGTKNNQAAPGTQSPDVVQLVGPVRLDQDLRKLPYVAPKEEFDERRLMRYPHEGTEQTSAPSGYGTAGLAYVQSLLKNVWRPTPTMPGPLLTFEGLGNTCGCAPPDTNGDVGPNHYIEPINETFKIFDKNGNTLSGPTTYNSFFSGLTGTPCANANDGDPFVFYDQVADRWVLSDFAFPSFPGSSFWQCIGVSQTPNPVSGGWFLYAIQVDPANPTFLGDYPKMAMWNNPLPGGAYHLTMNLFSSPTTFNGVRVYALDRASMLAGGPTNAIAYTLTPAQVADSYSFVAATFRTGTPPPAGRDEFVLAIDSPASGGVTLTQVHGRLFHVDFATPGNSTFGVGPNHLPNAEIAVNGFVDAFTITSNLVPQQGTATKLDTLGDKIMTPVVYQNRAGVESLWADSTVLLNYPNGPTAVRWYQFNVTGGSFPATAAQQQDWTNGSDGLWRWMPSIAVDAAGNTVIGYSTSGTTQFPSIRYAGRLVADPPSNLAQGEAIMIAGGGSQTSTSRWGDYTMTTLDTDGMTFWHVNEYYPTTSGGAWHTRIGKFKFETISTPTRPSGPTSGSTGTNYTYSTGGATSNLGHPVQYRFDWADGSPAVWLPVGTTSQQHSWTSPGTYLVRARARCSIDNGVLSNFSNTLSVTITASTPTPTPTPTPRPTPTVTPTPTPAGEVISTPTTPSGPASGSTGTNYTYSTGGSTSNLGHPVQYRFDWADGSPVIWLPVGTTSQQHSWTSPGTYLVRARARCSIDNGVVSNFSNTLSVTITASTPTPTPTPGEVISTPTKPSGPASGSTGTNYTYSTSGSTSSLGHPVQYRFDWADGSPVIWLPVGTTSQQHSWTSPGTYLVRARARCSIDNGVVSSFSNTLSVTITP